MAIARCGSPGQRAYGEGSEAMACARLEVARARAAFAVAGRQGKGGAERGCGCGEALRRGGAEWREGGTGETYGAEASRLGEAERIRLGCGDEGGPMAPPADEDVAWAKECARLIAATAL